MRKSVFRIKSQKGFYLLLLSVAIEMLFIWVDPFITINAGLYVGKNNNYAQIPFVILSDLIYGLAFFVIGRYVLHLIFGFSIKNLWKGILLGWPILIIMFINLQIMSRHNIFDYSFGTGLSAVFFALCGALMIGFFEELVFRAGILMSLRSCLSDKEEWLAIALSSLIFSLSHAINFTWQGFWDTINQIVLAFAIGTLFSAIYIISKNILVLIILHALVDTTDSFSSAIYKGVQTSGPDYIVIAFALLAIIYACLIYIKYRKSKALK